MQNPKVSIVVPYHDIPETAFFISRLMKSIEKQTFKDYEILLLKKGRMGETYNEAIRQSKGEIIKLMGMDDYFYHENALGELAMFFESYPEIWWMISPCLHTDGINVGNLHIPAWNAKLYEGNNTVGGFACVTIRNKDIPLINEDLDWVVDVDWYWRIYLAHGIPRVTENPNVVIGVGLHQTSNTLSQNQKDKEHEYVRKTYGK